jgi:hypothetical protein
MTAPPPSSPADSAVTLDAAVATELARRALTNIAREYPNHPQYWLDGATDLKPPRGQHPIFFGCFDWHSAVHTHWLLVRLLHTVSALPVRTAVEAALTRAFDAAKAGVEADYLARHPSFERPYGLAWLMLLAADTAATPWAAALAPLAAAARANVERWMASLRYAVRSGTHNQTAFALTLIFDAAATLADPELLTAVRTKALALFSHDTDAPLRFEPSGEDFLSPSLMEADLMRRVLPPHEFSHWLGRFLPGIPQNGAEAWLPPGEVDDETDGKWVHLHGLNLSRAWNLENLAAALPPADARARALAAAAAVHRAAGLHAVLATQHYAGDHWLPSFAVYLLTTRGGGRRPAG